jgi:hypothetical protein
MIDPALIDSADLTRRRLLQAGGATAATALLVLHPWASTLARAAEASGGDAPGYLIRSSYVDLANPKFAFRGGTLQLVSVGDLSGPGQAPALRDAEDAFSLVFSGPASARVASGVQRLSHPELGTFDLFLVPVGAPGPDQGLEAVVNRVLSRAESRRTPPRAPRAPRWAAAAPSDDLTKPASLPGSAKSAIRSVHIHRTKRGAKCVVELRASAHTREMVAWLRRGDKLIAVATRDVKGERVAFTLKGARRLRKGRYDLDVIAFSRDGDQSSRRGRVTLR